VIEFAADGAVIQIAARGKQRDLLLGPYRDRAARVEPAGGFLSAGSPRARSAQTDARPATTPTGSNKQEDHR
jgi:hypothetical protein